MNPRRVKVSTVLCLGVCMKGPILVVYPDGVWYYHLDKALIDRIVDEHLLNNQPVADHIFHAITETLPTA